MERLGELLGGDDRLLRLLGESVEFHGRSRRGWCAGRGPELPGFYACQSLTRFLTASWCAGRSGASRARAAGRAGRRGRGAVGGLARLVGEAGREDDPDLDVAGRRSRSPAFGLSRGMPWPVSRNVRPVWVSGGIVSRTGPSACATGTSPRGAPRARVIGSSRVRSAPIAGEDRMRPDPRDQVEVGRAVRSPPPRPSAGSGCRSRRRAGWSPRAACRRPRRGASCRGTPPRGRARPRPRRSGSGPAPPARSPRGRSRSPPAPPPPRPISAEDVVERRLRRWPVRRARPSAAARRSIARPRRPPPKNVRKKSQKSAVVGGAELVADVAAAGSARTGRRPERRPGRRRRPTPA